MSMRHAPKEIISGQQSEIRAMRGRLEMLERGLHPDASEYPALGSTRGTQ